MLWNAKNGSVDLGDTRMHYVSMGGEPRAMVILPGLSDGLATVQGKALLLAKPYRMFFDDFTVYMFSRKDDMPESYAIRDMAADQARAMRALGIERACVMGVSQGGMIAQWLAIDCPEMVERLALAVAAPRANDVIRSCLACWTDCARRGDHRVLMIDTAEKSYSPTYLKKYRRFYPALGLIARPASYDRFLINASAILGFDALDRLNDIQCPTLIICGSEDKIVGARASHDIHARIPDSILIEYPGLGHAAYEEARDFNARVYRFMMGGSQ